MNHAEMLNREKLKNNTMANRNSEHRKPGSKRSPGPLGLADLWGLVDGGPWIRPALVILGVLRQHVLLIHVKMYVK